MPSKTTVAIICLTIIICTAILAHVNGAIVSTGIVGIIGLGGYAVAKSKHDKGNG